MARLYVILGFVAVALYIYALVDTITVHSWRIKSLNKPLWVLIEIVLPVLGALLWFVVGKSRGNQAPAPRRASRRPVGPDDDPDFLRKATLMEQQQARIRQLEAELKALDDDSSKE
jgi:hypothetical protein